MGREGDSFMSPDLQREKIQAWADYRGFTIAAWYTDLDVSGREGVHRPEFERMMADAKNGLFEAVAVYRLTRFARSVSQAAARYRELRTLDIALVSVTEDIDTTTASGAFMQNMLFAMAEFESERIGEEWRNVHAQRRRRGIAHVVSPMLGYRTERAEIVGVDEGEAEAVRLIFDLAASGANRHEIRRQLHDRGHRPKLGGEWFPIASIRDVIANPTYAGMLRLGDDLVEGAHEPIVTLEQWQAAQTSAKRVAEVARFSRGLLAGLMICSSCGYRMTYQDTYGRRAAHYRCGSSSRSESCPRKVTIAADATDAYVEELFLSRFDLKRMPNQGRLTGARRRQGWRRQAATRRARIEELSRALDELAKQRFAKGSLQQAEYERLSTGYLAERAALEEEVAQLERAAQQAATLDRDVLELWPTLDVGAKRRALRLLIDRIVVRPAERPGSHHVDFENRLEIHWIR